MQTVVDWNAPLTLTRAFNMYRQALRDFRNSAVSLDEYQKIANQWAIYRTIYARAFTKTAIFRRLKYLLLRLCPEVSVMMSKTFTQYLPGWLLEPYLAKPLHREGLKVLLSRPEDNLMEIRCWLNHWANSLRILRPYNYEGLLVLSCAHVDTPQPVLEKLYYLEPGLIMFSYEMVETTLIGCRRIQTKCQEFEGVWKEFLTKTRQIYQDIDYRQIVVALRRYLQDPDQDTLVKIYQSIHRRLWSTEPPSSINLDKIIKKITAEIALRVKKTHSSPLFDEVIKEEYFRWFPVIELLDLVPDQLIVARLQPPSKLGQSLNRTA